MADVGMDGIWELASVIQGGGERTGGATYATVTRVDNEGTVWVHVPGGVEETPATGLNTASVKAGDVVSVEIGGNRASVVGNATAPSVGAREVEEAVRPLEERVTTAQETAETAQRIAEEASEISGDTDNHFWSDANGVHVADVEEEDWNTAVAGGFADYDETDKPYRNILVGRLGILLRSCLHNLVSISRSAIAFFDGGGNTASNVIASFGSSGAVIGYEADAHVEVDPDSLDIKDGADVLATFDASGARIGANSQQAQIEFCDGLGYVENRLGSMSLRGTDGASTYVSKMNYVGSDRENAYGGAGVGAPDYDSSTDSVSANGDLGVGIGGESSAIGEEYWSSASVRVEAKRTGATLGPSIMAQVQSGTASNDLHDYRRGINKDGFFEWSQLTPTRHSGAYWSTPSGTTLWSGVMYMTAGHTITLDFPVSSCPNGIVLHWQPYTSSTVRNYFHQYCYVPKKQVTNFSSQSVCFTLSTSKFANVATKMLYIGNNQITGHADNNATGTSNGITYANNYWVLTAVYAC